MSNNWYSKKVKLPPAVDNELSADVLAYRFDGVMCVARYDHQYKQWSWRTHNGWALFNPTHWTELPKPPDVSHD